MNHYNAYFIIPSKLYVHLLHRDFLPQDFPEFFQF